MKKREKESEDGRKALKDKAVIWPITALGVIAFVGTAGGSPRRQPAAGSRQEPSNRPPYLSGTFHFAPQYLFFPV